MGRREELLRAEAEAWDEVQAACVGLPDEMLERPGLNAEGWAVRDLMGHLAYWCADCARVLERIEQGTFDPSAQPLGDERIDAINDEAFERSRMMSIEEVRGELHRARAAMLERFGRLTALTAEADEWFEESGPRHYTEHLPELTVWVRSLDG